MRFRLGSIRAPALILSLLSIALTGCAGSPENSISTANLAPVRAEPSYGSNQVQANATIQRLASIRIPARPRPANTPPTTAATRTAIRNRSRRAASDATNRGPYAYEPDARWRQPTNLPPRQPSYPPQAAYAPQSAPQPSYAQHNPNMIEVREGDTLYSLSRRYNVPVGDIVAANRLPNERIAIGQRLVMPTRYR